MPLTLKNAAAIAARKQVLLDTLTNELDLLGHMATTLELVNRLGQVRADRR